MSDTARAPVCCCSLLRRSVQPLLLGDCRGDKTPPRASPLHRYFPAGGLSPFPAISARHRAGSKATRSAPTGGWPNSPLDFEPRFASKFCRPRKTSLPERVDPPNRLLIAWAAVSVEL